MAGTARGTLARATRPAAAATGRATAGAAAGYDASMRIEDLRVTVVGAPWRELTFVELTTDDGRTGLGEVRMVNKTETLVACLRELGPRYVVGSDPFEVERLGWHFGRGEYGRPGEVSQSALSAFDMACWDLIGQALGTPVHRLLGGRFRDRVPAYANGWYQAEREPARIAELAAGVVARGYRALKLDPFGAASVRLSAPERRLSLAIVEAVRSAVGSDIEIMIEMHGRFGAAEAIALARDLEPFRPAWIEEPVPPENPEPLRRVRAATTIPVAAGSGSMPCRTCAGSSTARPSTSSSATSVTSAASCR